MEENEQNPKDLWNNIKKFNNHITEAPKKSSTKFFFQEVMANSPDLVQDINLQIQQHENSKQDYFREN